MSCSYVNRSVFLHFDRWASGQIVKLESRKMVLMLFVKGVNIVQITVAEDGNFLWNHKNKSEYTLLIDYIPQFCQRA
jgi:hypothetical protein